jgi:beta-ureidopropionase / N-carbamoyl-L-amino-acid hydrolase
MSITVNETRLRDSFNKLAEFGSTEDDGINRPALSIPHLEARKWFFSQAKESGLEVFVDGAGNHSAVLRQPGADKVLMLGSHLDSVPNGGRFDGALGVISALEVLRTIKETRSLLKYHLEAIDFTDEESQLIECLGSRSLIGDISTHDLQYPICGRKILNKVFKRVRMTDKSVLSSKRSSESIAGYLELHIEQGSILTEKNVQIGVVTGIVGIRNCRFAFIGKRDHAGTTPMSKRLDAGKGASSFLLSMNKMVINSYPNCVANVGRMQFYPGNICIVPERVDVFVEFRSLDEDELDKLETDINNQALKNACKYGLKVDTHKISNVKSVMMNSYFENAIRNSAQLLGLKYMNLSSGAGHDAQLMARITPAGMIFIPSSGGSHNPNENAHWEDCINGANVLLQTVLKIGK